MLKGVQTFLVIGFGVTIFTQTKGRKTERIQRIGNAIRSAQGAADLQALQRQRLTLSVFTKSRVNEIGKLFQRAGRAIHITQHLADGQALQQLLLGLCLLALPHRQTP